MMLSLSTRLLRRHIIGQARLLSTSRTCLSANPGQHQGPIVDLLWKRRAQAKAEAKALAMQQTTGHPAGTGRQLSSRTVEHSVSSVTYEFSLPENAALTDRYRNPWNQLRFGRLLEDLDALAGTVAYKHCCSDNPLDKDLHIVTASVDRIKYKHRPELDDDITLTGQVTWVGRSSMEIRMQGCAHWTNEPFLECYFTFVARDPETGKAAQINPLTVNGPMQEGLFAVAAEREAVRKAKRNLLKHSSVGSALDEDGMAAAHALLDEADAVRYIPTLAPSTDVLMADTGLQNTLTTMPQHRNTAGRIFGGFLMRRAFELAHATAYMFCGRKPVFHELDDVTFKAPVNVGDLLRLQSAVMYTSEDMDALGRATIHIEVLARVITPEKASLKLSNTFYFTFGLAEHADGTGKSALGKDVDLRRVLPASREQAYRVIERYQADELQREEDKRTGSTAAPS